MEVEKALLEGEQNEELCLLQADKELLEKLNEKIGKMQKTTNTNTGKVWYHCHIETTKFIIFAIKSFGLELNK